MAAFACAEGMDSSGIIKANFFLNWHTQLIGYVLSVF